MDIKSVLDRGVETILPSREGLKKLIGQKQITCYQGFDPSMPSLHLGNLVGILKLRQFQKLGHKVIFLVGDFTGMIGDPTDKDAIRKKLSRQEVIANSQTWKGQVEKILDFGGKNPARMIFNSDWNDKISFKELIDITSNFTVQQMLERDMFQKRIKEQKPIGLHEFLYPVAQAIDCVELKVDLEIGGSDQIFNMLAGRNLMKAVNNKEKYVLATKLLVDKNGNKVGKTTGNALFLDSQPHEMYAGIMSFPDEITALAFELLTEMDLTEIGQILKKDPMRQKKQLAFEIVSFLYGLNKADDAQKYFEQVFQQKLLPQKAVEIKIKEQSLPLLDLVFATGQLPSRSEAKRLISQKAVEVNGRIEDNPLKEIAVEAGDTIIKIGKKTFVKIIA